jgi:hypothetical protein
MPEHKATCPNNLTIQNNVLVQGSAWPAAGLLTQGDQGSRF